MADILNAIHSLDTSARHNHKEKFIPQSSAIVESIRIMLFASGTARKDAPLVESHRMLKVHHRNIMNTLSKLVLSAKLASSVWPPPDAISRMQGSASEVLLSVKSFVGAAQEAGVEIRGGNEGSNEVPNSVTNEVAMAPRSPQQIQAPVSLSQPPSQAQKVGSTPSNLVDEDSAQITNSEIIAQLERYTTNVVQMINALVNAIKNNECNSAMMITEVRSMVTEVGNFLAVVDDLPLDSLSEELTVDFKVHRLALYNSISGLVMATSAATGQYAPSNGLEQVNMSTSLVEKAVKDLLISTKFLIEEKEAFEQQTLQRYIDQYGGSQRRASEAQIRTRRAISMDVPTDGRSSFSTEESSTLYGSTAEQPQADSPVIPMSAPVSKLETFDSDYLMESLSRKAGANRKDKLQKLLGVEAVPNMVNGANRNVEVK
jgi:hypothetical protein